MAEVGKEDWGQAVQCEEAQYTTHVDIWLYYFALLHVPSGHKGCSRCNKQCLKETNI